MAVIFSKVPSPANLAYIGFTSRGSTSSVSTFSTLASSAFVTNCQLLISNIVEHEAQEVELSNSFNFFSFNLFISSSSAFLLVSAANCLSAAHLSDVIEPEHIVEAQEKCGMRTEITEVTSYCTRYTVSIVCTMCTVCTVCISFPFQSCTV